MAMSPGDGGIFRPIASGDYRPIKLSLARWLTGRKRAARAGGSHGK
jgi:hypothetical protein